MTLHSNGIGGTKSSNDLDVAALNPSARRKALAKRSEASPSFRIVADADHIADQPHPLTPLRARRERPRRRAAEERDEIAAVGSGRIEARTGLNDADVSLIHH
jgi:hypothetical protein